MSPIVIVLLLLGAIGHTILWAAAVNRVHALGVHRRLVHAITLVCGLMLVLLPLVTGGVLLGRFPAARMSWATVATYGAWTYVGLCTALCVFAACQRLYWRLHPERRGALVANHTSHICPADSSGPLAAGVWAWVCHLPGNEVLHVCVHEKKVAIPRLAASHAPVRIAHLTDLHMSGRVGRAYFEQVVEEANACKADIVAVTGDIVERENCIDWIPATLARLRAEGGVYYVLGNHDQEVNVDRLNAALTDAGLVHLGGACHEANIRGTSFILAGNELPWFE
ncbi:MAG TPA: metallophosphoesterase, partial [Lacipirellulaceae bacterium]|nr:metallophosphoesterase [Lacipirellulaceae bacterium]